jgi:hypothetical protein
MVIIGEHLPPMESIEDDVVVLFEEAPNNFITNSRFLSNTTNKGDLRHLMTTVFVIGGNSRRFL